VPNGPETRNSTRKPGMAHGNSFTPRKWRAIWKTGGLRKYIASKCGGTKIAQKKTRNEFTGGRGPTQPRPQKESVQKQPNRMRLVQCEIPGSTVIEGKVHVFPSHFKPIPPSTHRGHTRPPRRARTASGTQKERQRPTTSGARKSLRRRGALAGGGGGRRGSGGGVRVPHSGRVRRSLALPLPLPLACPLLQVGGHVLPPAPAGRPR